MPDQSNDDWLSLAEAAQRLGVNRIRVREAVAAGLIGARRDNRGFWRVSLAADIGDVARRMRELRLQPDALVELLFDEIEELGADLAERDSSLERLHAVTARQQDMLARALSLAENAKDPGNPADHERLAGLNERSLRLLDRAFETIGGLESEVGRHAEVAERQKGLLDRLFEIANKKLDGLSSQRLGGKGWLNRLRGRRGRNGRR